MIDVGNVKMKQEEEMEVFSRNRRQRFLVISLCSV